MQSSPRIIAIGNKYKYEWESFKEICFASSTQSLRSKRLIPPHTPPSKPFRNKEGVGVVSSLIFISLNLLIFSNLTTRGRLPPASSFLFEKFHYSGGADFNINPRKRTTKMRLVGRQMSDESLPIKNILFRGKVHLKVLIHSAQNKTHEQKL